ncbi:hypothetical protein SEA_GORKO_83 [Gordonia phage Gorko]|uniref:Uncharacterized protein n=1 Tax=Gordonia phage Gorko TaxID=2571248 RepID=A0A4Y6EGT7_9CAUD|nr:hypothetical protein SEA_GORKO_83 [Gordonia phage Gorko]
MKIGKINLDDDHARCRIYGHAWDAVGDIIFNAEGYWETLGCLRCGLRRRALVERRTGYIKNRTYTYPKGYHIKGGLDRAQRGKVRLKVMETGGFG